ncbi:conserved hypothetical protein [Leishmania braziliensis MHOM/BR/75/M2904]|uniref:EF-hand domain-containing protein n=2 Tax=Leishmania braziliensis TaxID=5660 RepID=A4HMI4_LEIBR|nr:conserved hypothetical protein [Leishmania braziliensis MHOM/BR/75/M2904]KAI5689233.1 hypothetical protein MNV84_07380 [Leishmania braziliensis]CAJ2480217.1 unnamed protein product [Leishmania braziliensis]CAM43371.1 conserved hypothetical protein [Leishmania braziliensis MHOM/BR/75/M2904]SYZ69445.1 hypothetical_protein [Leishmania braziliensis MHOM/BR/75/M2904]
MAPVNVQRVYSVFHLFAVDTADAHAGAAAAQDAIRESYIPVCFLAAAAREIGYYPTSSAVSQFTKTVPSAAAGAVTFAAFLQFCENVAHTNQPGRSAIYKLVDDIDPRGSGMISHRELLLVLTSGSATITDGEIDAAMKLLDPTNCGYVQLADLAALLIDSCERQQQPEKQQQRCGAARDSHSRQTSAQPEDSRQHLKQWRGDFTKRGYETPPSPPLTTAAAEGERAQAPEQRRSAAAVGECDSSLKRTGVGLTGEAAFQPHGSLCDRQNTVEQTQTPMTVDADVQLSKRHSTPTLWRRRFAKSSSVAVSPATPLQRAGGGSAASSPAAQTPVRPLQPTVSAAATEGAPPQDKAVNNEPHLHYRSGADANGGARYTGLKERNSKQQVYSSAELNARGGGVFAGGNRSSGTEAALVTTAAMPTKKADGLKCCVML